MPPSPYKKLVEESTIFHNKSSERLLHQFGHLPGRTGSGGGGGGGSLAGSNGGADLGGVEVVVHQAVDDVGQLGLHQRDTEGLQSGVDGSESVADPLHKLEDLVNGGVAREELVNVRHHVHTDVAQEALLLAAGLAGSSQEQEGNHQLQHLLRVDFCVVLGIVSPGLPFHYIGILIFLPHCHRQQTPGLF